MRIRPVGDEGRTDRHDEAISCFRNFANAPNKKNCQRHKLKLVMCHRHATPFMEPDVMLHRVSIFPSTS